MKAPKSHIKRTIAPGEQIDVRSGLCSYGDMVALGRVLDAKKEGGDVVAFDVEMIKTLIRTIHHKPKDGVYCEPSINITNIKYASDIAQGVQFWRERENEKLKYAPSAEEKRAGYEALSKVTGPTGVASTIAEKFGVEGGPDAVFLWPYASVFMVLYIDLERYEFQKRLREIRDNKRKRDEKNRRWGRRK